MPDIGTELDDILNSFSEADRPAMRTLLTNNPTALTQLSSAATVYKAFVDGDTATLSAIAPAATNPPAAQPISLGLDQINALLSERDKKLWTSPEFTTAVDTMAEKKAKAMFESERANVIGRSAELSDTIASIRETHLREFNEPMDSAAFKTFFQAEGTKYGNDLTGSYNAFVAKKREDKRVADGIAAGLAAAATNNVAGSSVPTTHNPLSPNFVDFNVQRIGTTVTPTVDVDKAAQVFATMQRGWTQ